MCVHEWSEYSKSCISIRMGYSAVVWWCVWGWNMCNTWSAKTNRKITTTATHLYSVYKWRELFMFTALELLHPAMKRATEKKRRNEWKKLLELKKANTFQQKLHKKIFRSHSLPCNLKLWITATTIFYLFMICIQSFWVAYFWVEVEKKGHKYVSLLYFVIAVVYDAVSQSDKRVRPWAFHSTNRFCCCCCFTFLSFYFF